MFFIAMLTEPGRLFAGQSFGIGCLFAFLSLFMVAATVRKSQKNRPRETEILKKIASMVNRSLDLNSILNSCLEEMLEVLGMDAGVCSLRATPEASPRTICHGLNRNILALLEEGKEDNAIEQQAPAMMTGDALRWRTAPLAEALQKEGLHFSGPYPIRSGNRILGFLGLASKDPKAPSEGQVEFLNALTEILGVAIVNAQLREQSNKLSEDLIALQEVNKIISQGFNLEDIIHRIVIEGRRLAKTSQCHLFKLDDKRQCLAGSASTQTENLDIRTVNIPFSEASTAVTALMEKRVIAVEDILRDTPGDSGLMEPLGWRAAIFAPLLTKERAIGVLVCSDDARERKFTDEEILRAEALAHQAAIALENAELFHIVSRSQREWETTFDAMQDCVSVHDTTGKVIRANVALARRLKTIPQKVVGRYCSDVYHPEGSSSKLCHHTRSLKSEATVVEEVALPVMDGVFQISVSPWYDKNNRMVGSIHVAKDISNERQLQQQLIQSEKLSAIGELISGIAHELNNPLTGVMGYSQLLQLRKDLDDRAKDNLLKINNLALRCQKIVQNLLSFARKQKPERTLSDINDILEKTVELRSYELQVNNIELTRELDRHLPKTIADAHQLQQVFLNVLTNAEQAMLEAHGKGHLTIRTSLNTANARIVVEVIDDGPGIPENYLTRIFDPFFTTKEVGKGTGLGLSLSYGMIKEHGGNIYARSKLGEGATFVIELPIIMRIQEEKPTLEMPPQALQFEKLVRGKRILVVDDEKYILDFFVEVFQALPLQVDTASNGHAAMQKMQGTDYDLIITDFKMPQMSGKDLFNWIKENRPQNANRIIFVTGDTVSAETRSFFENNQNRFLAKPFKIEEVKEAVQQTLEAAASQ
ncbi:MAG TPA: ATP-binding protein [Acidobacteriota bacterium]|nr:ATP-binding protein [Acidobacteriota bacterium]